MADREKVLKGLENCSSSDSACRECVYYGAHCVDNLCADALELLKEQQKLTKSLQHTVVALLKLNAETPVTGAELETWASVFERAENINGVVQMSTEVRDILVRILRKMPSQKPTNPLFLPDHKFGCPSCFAVVGLGNNYCWNCGRGLKWNETD